MKPLFTNFAPVSAKEWKQKMSLRMSGKNNPAYGKDYSKAKGKNNDTEKTT
jgi:hypothetical protein